MVGFGKKLKHFFGKKKGHLEEAWHYKVNAQVLSGVNVIDVDGDGASETIFGTKQGELFCLGASGNPKWKFNVHENLDVKEAMFLDPDNMNSVPAKPLVIELAEKGKKFILFGSEMGMVYCLDAAGQLVWKFKAADAVRGQIVAEFVTNKETKDVLFGSADGYLYVLSAQGNLRWKIKAKAPIESTPAVCTETHQMLFGTDDGTLYSVDYSGKLLWGFRTKNKITAQPTAAVLDDEKTVCVVVGSYDGFMYVFESNGNLKWKYPTKGPIVSKASVVDVEGKGKKSIFFGSCDNKIYALNYQGDKLWDFETDFWVVEQPLVVDMDGDGTFEIIAGSYDTTLYALDAKGNYELDYVPGLSGVVHQAGHYSDVMTQEPGKLQGKKLYEFQANSVIVGVSFDEASKRIIIAEKIGEIHSLHFVMDKS